MKILIADEHGLVRRGLQQIIAAHRDWRVSAEVDNADDLLRLLRGDAFDVLIVDVSLGERRGIDLLGQIHAERPSLRVLVLSMHAEEEYAVLCLRAGASGYIQKDASPEELIHAIEHVASGRTYVSSAFAQKLVDRAGGSEPAPPHERLSHREFEVLRLLAQGHGPTEIGHTLSLSVKTVSTYRSRMMDKMGFRTNADIVVYAIHHGIV